MSLTPVWSSAFKRDVKRSKKQGRDMDSLKDVLELLIDGKELPEACRDHGLSGNWRGYRDAHVAPDWILLYRVQGDELQLARLGTHAQIFG